jgi:hypothetical protein
VEPMRMACRDAVYLRRWTLATLIGGRTLHDESRVDLGDEGRWRLLARRAGQLGSVSLG